jgi:hypothetical protein
MAKNNLLTFPEGSKLRIDYVNASTDSRYGEEESSLKDCWCCETLEDGSIQAKKGDLFRMLVGDLGRCVGKVYVDGPDGSAVPIGWVFQKRAEYGDCKQTYLQESWAVITSPKA